MGRGTGDALQRMSGLQIGTTVGNVNPDGAQEAIKAGEISATKFTFPGSMRRKANDPWDDIKKGTWGIKGSGGYVAQKKHLALGGTYGLVEALADQEATGKWYGIWGDKDRLSIIDKVPLRVIPDQNVQGLDDGNVGQGALEVKEALELGGIEAIDETKNDLEGLLTCP